LLLAVALVKQVSTLLVVVVVVQAVRLILAR
jgi:hypothetical protein